MEAAMDTPGLEAAQRMRLHLAIGKAAEDLGDYALAMQHFDAADAVRRGASSFDSDAFSIQIDRLIARCTPELMARAAELGSRDATPVLILGMPRSGTTLVEQIVSMHPEVGLAASCISGTSAGWRGSAPARPGTRTPFLAQAAADYLGVLRAIAPKVGASDRQDAVQLPLGRADPLGIPARDHHPLPPRCSRHRAVDPSNSFPSEPGISDRRRRTGRVFPRLPATRRPLAERAAGGSLHRGRLRGPDPRAGTGIRRIIAACGLAWHDACLRPESNPRAVKTPSKWQTRQPIYRTSVARWRRYEPWLGPLRALVDDGPEAVRPA